MRLSCSESGFCMNGTRITIRRFIGKLIGSAIALKQLSVVSVNSIILRTDCLHEDQPIRTVPSCEATVDRPRMEELG
uniref:Secreted protein n=1 Tax=Angiostrongylus cantonensis TaxID=6313 RepID=A0A0K0D2T7_ANGCA